MHIISYKSKTNIISKLLEQGNIKELEKQSFLSKIFSSKKNFADIYFHSGTIDDESIENTKNSKLTIVNSHALKHKLLLQTNIEPNKIQVIYPSIEVTYKNPSEVKKEVCEKLQIDLEKEIIFFTAKNFEKSGIKEFIQIIASLSNDNFHVIIAGDNREITTLKFKMSKLSIAEHITLVEDYENIDDLFLASDIFILPSYNQAFASTVLKAMFCECAVFVTSINHANELVDVFATMDDPDDRSMTFKIDALLLGIDDLIQIKKDNRQKAKEYTLENNLKRINEFIKDI